MYSIFLVKLFQKWKFTYVKPQKVGYYRMGDNIAPRSPVSYNNRSDSSKSRFRPAAETKLSQENSKTSEFTLNYFMIPCYRRAR